MMMKRIMLLLLGGFWAWMIMQSMPESYSKSAFAAESPNAPSHLSLEDVLSRIEKRYSTVGFTAIFRQTSTIKAMDITDSASGNITVKRPGKMRWEYETPEPQVIVTDGNTLWVYKPEDHQVMVGNYPTFFGDGKGASFLSDMKLIREKFNIALEPNPGSGDLRLKLIPKKKGFDISKVNLRISEDTFDIQEIITYNADGDETRIILEDIQFYHQLDDSLFQFTIQDNMDVLQLDE